MLRQTVCNTLVADFDLDAMHFHQDKMLSLGVPRAVRSTESVKGHSVGGTPAR